MSFLSSTSSILRRVQDVARIPVDIVRVVMKEFVRPEDIRFILNQETPLKKLKIVPNVMKTFKIESEEVKKAVREFELSRCFLFTLDKRNKDVQSAWKLIEQNSQQLQQLRDEFAKTKEESEKNLKNLNHYSSLHFSPKPFANSNNERERKKEIEEKHRYYGEQQVILNENVVTTSENLRNQSNQLLQGFDAYLKAKNDQEEQYDRWSHVFFLWSTFAVIAAIANLTMNLSRGLAQRKRERNISESAVEEAQLQMREVLNELDHQRHIASAQSAHERELAEDMLSLSASISDINHKLQPQQGYNDIEEKEEQHIGPHHINSIIKEIERETEKMHNANALVVLASAASSVLVIALSFFSSTSS
eukprot:m.44175 g.44175  ORF g.44175 m.44175 type:complete len:362 (-) comp10587_c0_seq2:981-2066(-)